MTREHCVRCYTPREWLLVLLLICLSGYVVHNESRAAILVRMELNLKENASLQLQLIRLNRERMELLHEMMFGAHRLPMDASPFPGDRTIVEVSCGLEPDERCFVSLGEMVGEVER